MDAFSIIQAIAEVVYLGQQMINVYHLLSPDSIPDEDAFDDIAQQLDDMYDLIDARLSTDLSFESIKCINLTDDYELGTGPWPGLATGGDAGQPLPPGVAFGLWLPTARLGTRGRKFIPGFTETSNVTGEWASAAVDDMELFAAPMVTGFLGATSASPWAFGVPDLNGVFRPFQGFGVSTTAYYQRRRRQGVGA